MTAAPTRADVAALDECIEITKAQPTHTGRTLRIADAAQAELTALLSREAQLLDLLAREPAEGHTKHWQDERRAALNTRSAT